MGLRLSPLLSRVKVASSLNRVSLSVLTITNIGSKLKVGPKIPKNLEITEL